MPPDCAPVPCGDPPSDLRFSLRLCAGPSEVRAALAVVVAWLDAAGIDAENSGRLELALAEALNNVVRHALAGQGGAAIDVSLIRRANAIACEIRDGGRPMPGGRLPAGRAPEIGSRPGDLPEGGFGWFLIRELTAGLRYSRRNGTNRLAFRVDLTPD